MTEDEILASIDRHFAACYILSPLQLKDHRADGTCPECEQGVRSPAARTLATLGGLRHQIGQSR